MSGFWPEDILIKILTRLPVKSLLKFRCVSKSWYSLITSPDFINTHLSLNTTNNNNNNNKFLFFKNIYSTPVKRKYFLSLNHKDTLNEYSRFEYSFRSDYHFKIVGSCNGLLCLLNFVNEIIVLWNPAIRKSVTLPTPNITHLMDGENIGFPVVALGFDHRAHDYKVVRVVERQDGSKIYPPKVELFELSKGSWRGISCNAPPYLYSGYLSYAYINGVVHWIALDKSDVNGFRSLIVAFNMVDEIFREMALPDSIADGYMLQIEGSVLNISIGIFEESLMVCHLNQHPSDNFCSCSVWFMKEYGVAKSWVKQFNVVLRGELQTVLNCMKMKNGDLLLGTTTGQLVLCNPKHQQMKDVEFYGPSTQSYYVDTYMESLVLLKGRQTDSCDAVTSKRKEDDNEDQQCPTILE